MTIPNAGVFLVKVQTNYACLNVLTTACRTVVIKTQIIIRLTKDQYLKFKLRINMFFYFVTTQNENNGFYRKNE